MTPNFFQAATLKNIWVEATLKKYQVAPYKNLGRFYRVPFKSLFRVQIKRAIESAFLKKDTVNHFIGTYVLLKECFLFYITLKDYQT